jgi:methionyl-tRNA formyltransferase
MQVLFLRRADCAHSDRAEAFLRSRFDAVEIVSTDGPGTEIEPRPGFAALFAFRSHVIVRKPVLDAIPLCVNFHPGPPERRGSGCVNFAIAQGDTGYGSTCHHIDEQIDHGPIIDVRRFPITDRDGVADVLAWTYDYMLCQFYDVAGAVAAGEPVPVSPSKWSGPCGKASEMNALREITLAPEARESLERQVRATSFGPYQPYVTLHGKRFVLAA